jgi:site-specific DNA-methyltransferase (adenine-specific)
LNTSLKNTSSILYLWGYYKLEIVYESDHGKIIHGDNVEVLKTLEPNSIDSCISDFPYAIEFMGKNWDSMKNWNNGEGIHGQFKGTGYSGKRRPAFYANTPEDSLAFYDWCLERAEALFPVMKPGGYVAIFGHPRMNHRMKSAFEDAGFKIVEEIDYLYLSGMPKNQDIGKMFDRAVGAEREIISEHRGHTGSAVESHSTMFDDDNYTWAGTYYTTKPSTEFAKLWDDWKTAGLKPSHEPITIFQKPLDGTYIENIKKWNCGAMNIGACRVPISQEDIEMLDAKASKNPTTNYSDKEDKIYGEYAKDIAVPANPAGRFPPNILLDEEIAKLVDIQTGITKSTGGSGIASTVCRARHIYGAFNQEKNDHYQNDSLGGYGDSGGGSRIFPIFKYCAKVSPSERAMPDGTRNPHVTVKPIELIMWLIKLLTPKGGYTVDITAGSCTHAVACERLNNKDNYNLSYLNIEIMNSDECPYCNVGAERVQAEIDSKVDTLF